MSIFTGIVRIIFTPEIINYRNREGTVPFDKIHLFSCDTKPYATSATWNPEKELL